MSDSAEIVPPSSEFSGFSEASHSMENRINVLDYRSKFKKAELDYTPQDTLADVLERAHLDEPVVTGRDNIKVFLQASSSFFNTDDLTKTFDSMGCAGAASIIVTNAQGASGEITGRTLEEYSANVKDIQPFGAHTSSGADSSVPSPMAQSPSPGNTPLVVRRDSGDAPAAAAAAAASAGLQDVQTSDGDSSDDNGETLIYSPLAQSPSPIGTPVAPPPLPEPRQISAGTNVAAAAAAAAVMRQLRHVKDNDKGTPVAKEKDNSNGNNGDNGDLEVGQSLKAMWKENTCAVETEEPYNARSRTGFAGLCNQGATCYLNSLVQALYMSPEFRNAVYSWSFDDYFEKALKHKLEKKPDMTEAEIAEFRRHTEEKSVPFQLQKLFAQLQLTKARAVSTKNLTKSFGWEAADAFTQHDTIELCQVLMDALEKAMAGTEQATLINDLFKGVMCDYVHCLGCQHENARHDPFLDVPLVIKGFGETHAVKSVEEALRKFITPEVLDENNLYNCEACGNKCRAVKGLRFEKFPYIVMLQMKRFDFDYTLMDRVKLCDRVSFPYTLDLADYLEGGKIDAEIMKKATSCEEHGGDEKVLEDDTTEEPPKEEEEPKGEEKPKEEEEATKEEEQESEKKQSDMIYDLYAILIHSGNANGGHYFAYIKDYRSGKWFQFNDSTVSEIGDAEIQDVFGRDSDDRTWSSSNYYRRSAYGVTAYALLYRKVDKERNVLPCADEDVPAKVREYVEKQNAEEAEREHRAKLERETCHLTVTYTAPTATDTKFFDEHESKTVGEVKDRALKAFGCEAKPEDTRLVLIDKYMSTREPLNDTDTLKMSGINRWKQDLELETKQPGEEWKVWNPNLINLHVFYQPQDTCPEDKDGKLSFTSVDVSVDKTEAVEKLRATIGDLVGIAPEKLRLLLRVNNNYATGDFSATLLDGTVLDRTDVSDGDDVYTEVCDTPNEAGTAENSAVFRYLDDIGNRVWYTLSYTDGRTFPVTIDQRLPLKALKARAGELLGLPFDRVVLKRGNQTYKTELKEMETSLRMNYIYRGDTIYVEEGLMGSHKVSVVLWVPEDNKYRPLFEMTAVETDLVKDFMEQVRAKYEETYGSDPKYPHSADPACYVLRGDSHGDQDKFPDPIVDGAVTLKEAVVYFSGYTTLVVQVLAQPLAKPVTKGTLSVFCYEWHPAAVRADQTATEIVVDKGDTVNDLRRALAALHRPLPGTDGAAAPAEVRAEDICVAMPKSYWHMGPPTVAEMLGAEDKAPAWAEGDAVTLKDISKSMYLRSGVSIVFWNGAEPLGQVPEAEQQKKDDDDDDDDYDKKVWGMAQNTRVTPAWNGASSWHRKETSIKIRTDDSDDEDAGDTKGTPAATAAAAAAAAATATAAAEEESNDNNNNNDGATA